MFNPLTLALSVATIVWSTVTKKNESNNNSSNSSSSSSSSSRTVSTLVNGVTPETWIFLSGMACTVVLQYGKDSLIRNLYYQRMKTMLLKWTRASSLDKSGVFLHTPTRLTSLTATASKNQAPLEHSDVVTTPKLKDGSTRLLGTRIALVGGQGTTNLTITLLTLQPRCELASQLSPPSVEFFYVVAGTGMVSQQGIIPTQQFQTGDAFVIDPLSVRWVSNKDGRVPLLLLRVTDTPSSSSPKQWTDIRLDPNTDTTKAITSLEVLTQGLAKVQKAAAEYYTTTNGTSDVVKAN